jgi:TM2 domain-containing membrane protein YozV
VSDEATCYLCGGPRDGRSRVCPACAARFGQETTDTRSAPLTLEQESAESLADSLEQMARRRLGEGTGYRSHVPLPPQMREEQEQRLRTRQEEARRQAVVENAEKLAARKEADLGKMLTHCPVCEAELPQDGPRFSFCTDCGADLPSVARPKTKRIRKPDASGVRDIRTPMRQLAEAHRQARQHQSEPQAAAVENINPVVYAVLSFLLPGLGQLLNRQVAKGVLTMVASFILPGLTVVGGVGVMVLRVLCAIDAYRIGERRRRGETVGETEWDLA